jgi:hypothetical protein
MEIYGQWLTGLRQAGFNIGDRQIWLQQKSGQKRTRNTKMLWYVWDR